MTPTHTSFFKNILESFDSFTSTGFISQRKEAISALKKIGFPSSNSEEYKFIPITKIIETTFAWNNQHIVSTLSSITSFLIPSIEANVIVLLNGVFSKELSVLDTHHSGFTLTSFANASPIIKSEIEKHLTPSEDAFDLVNTAYLQEGIFIQIADHVIIPKPFLILHLHDTAQQPVITHTKLVVTIGEGSQVSLIEKSDTLGNNPCFQTFSKKIIVNNQATYTYCKIQNDTGKIYQVSNTHIHQHKQSKTNTCTITLNGQLIRNNLTILIDGEQCESYFNGLYLVDKNTIVDNHTTVDHQKPNSFSNELYKGILDNHSKGIFNGKIYVRPDAQKTNAFQSNRNILLNNSATVHTKPQLEIWADDVKCSHGCTIGQLDEEAIFYLQARGIPYADAKKMLLYAFALDVLESIKDQKIKTYLDELIAERLHKTN